MSARPAIVVAIIAVHALALWLIWRVPLPVEAEVDSFTSVLFFFQPADRPITHSARDPIGVARAKRNGATIAAVRDATPPPTRDGTAITLPPAPPSSVDWSAQLIGAADATLDHQKVAQRQLGALLRKFEIPEDLRDPQRGPPSRFRWYEAGIHRFDTRGALPALHLNDRCVLVLLIFAACSLGHIEVHGDLFEGAAAAHDERIAAPRPNDVP